MSLALYCQQIGRGTRPDPRRDYYAARSAARLAARRYFRLLASWDATGWDKSLANRDMHEAAAAVPGGMTRRRTYDVMLPGWYARRQKYALAIGRSKHARELAIALDHMAREFSPRPSLRNAA
ncbi:hypothetical protein [Dyella caseinilytica]|uniref:Uncharacterized protein n=1 Tax=Dyella caseinilytica TaxID=1849581 RepID=A0ABX7GQS6_9GAMM|nr:hypothetical protein [Dyella caseinilytica]QRN52423.1 hypothetical protein ISN74_13150 [Dyella caseinilytica]GGA05843.1 hypothetical protein GCM10011408_28500 [Dyella caseinilytica]